MLAHDNREFDASPILDPTDLSIGELLAHLSGQKEKPLMFFYDGHPAKPGYHVTEVKAGHFAALDCGANPESWAEIFVQLWDVNEDPAHMTAGKFSAIIRKVTEHVELDMAAKLTFEVSDGVLPMQLYRAALPEIVGGKVHVQLSARPASCKPRDRWLAEQNKTAACGAPASGQACCR